MNIEERCPLCGKALFITKKMTLNWLQVMLALIPTIAIFYLLKLFLEDAYHYGRFALHVWLGAIGLIGLIFAKMVSKRRFTVKSCIGCDYVNTQEQVDT